MTVAAAATALDGSCAMACDTRGSGAYTYSVRAKFVSWKGWLIASAGPLLWHRFLTDLGDDVEPTPEGVADAFLAWARERGHGGQDHDHHFGVDGELLMVRAGRNPIRIGCDGSVIPCVERYAAIGSGAQVAVGAMWAIDGAPTWTPEVAVTTGVEAAIAHAPGCGGGAVLRGLEGRPS